MIGLFRFPAALTLATLMFCAAPRALDTPSHCAVGERVVFSCRTGTQKVASICALPGAGQAERLQYRFGVPGKPPELAYPAQSTPASEAFRAGTLMYSGGGGAWLAFDNAGASYFVYTGIGKGWKKEGVLARRDGRILANLTCRGDVTSEIGPELFDQARIPQRGDDFEIP